MKSPKRIASLLFLLIHACFAVIPSMVASLAGNYANTGFKDAVGQSALFNLPRQMAMDPTKGILYVADNSNSRIRAIDMNGNVTTVLPTGDYAYGLAFDPDNYGLYVSTFTKIMFLNLNNLNSHIIHEGRSWGGLHYYPANQTLYMVGNPTYLAKWKNPLTTANTTIVQLKNIPSFSSFNFEIDVNDSNKIYININHEVMWTNDTVWSLLYDFAGVRQTSGYINGLYYATRFTIPVAFAWNDAHNALYVADIYNNVIRRLVSYPGPGPWLSSTVAGVQSTSMMPFSPGIAGNASTANFPTCAEIYLHPTVPNYYFIADQYGVRSWYGAPPQFLNNSLSATYDVVTLNIIVTWKLLVPGSSISSYKLVLWLDQTPMQTIIFAGQAPPFIFHPNFLNPDWVLTLTPQNAFGAGTTLKTTVPFVN